MKVLFIDSIYQDYLAVQILHGLITLGHEVTELNYHKFMRQQYRNEFNIYDLYGNGFSYAFTLNDKYNEDNGNRELIENNISEHYYDIVIYTNLKEETSFLDLVLEKYKLGEIFIIDGQDTQTYYNIINDGHLNILYFKRELIASNYLFGTTRNVFPISYSIPKEKFQERKYYKGNIFVNDCSFGNFYIGERSNYKYENEQEYYDHYNNSVFALTCRKGGWDCMRHYEIIACHCLPIFMNLDSLPRSVMTTWPTDLQYQANSLYISYLYNYIGFNDDKQITKYYNLLDQFYDYAYNNMTTENTVKYLLTFC